jgi:Rieske 2Fe-2S family protein
MSGTTDRAPFPDLDEHEKVRHKGELVYPTSCCRFGRARCAFAAPARGRPHRGRVRPAVRPDEVARPTFDPSDAEELWHITNKQDWAICESVQRGMSSRAYRQGWYAPMEDASLDIRRWLLPRLERHEQRGSDD